MNRTNASNPDALLRSAQQGDPNALGKLLARYHEYLRLLARMEIDRRLQGKVDPSDLFQETFMDAPRDFRQFRGNSEPELAQWLRQIMANKAAMLMRRYHGSQKRDVRLERELQDEFNSSSQAIGSVLADSGTSPSMRAARREEAVLLANALGRLPADYREVMILHHLQGKSMDEVALVMGRSLDSVRKLRSRAIIKLRSTLRDETNES